MNKKAQETGFTGFIFIVMAVIIFIMALPMMNTIFGTTATESGGFTGFLITIIPYAIGAILLFFGIRMLSG